MPDSATDLKRLTIPEFSLGIARESGSGRLSAYLVEPARLRESDLPLSQVMRTHQGDLVAKANRTLDASLQDALDAVPTRRSGAIASLQTQFRIDQYLGYLGWAKAHPAGELLAAGVRCRWDREQTNALVEDLEERLKQLGMHGDRPTRDSGHAAIRTHAELAQSLVARIPAAAIARLQSGARAEDVAFALADAGRREGFVPATPVSVVSSSDGSRVFAVQGDLADPASRRASVASDQVPPGTAAALREALARMEDAAMPDAASRPALQAVR